jgi:putative protein kinase ArgK-like GTPase of G3E family
MFGLHGNPPEDADRQTTDGWSLHKMRRRTLGHSMGMSWVQREGEQEDRVMTGIHELFHELSTPDEFHCQAQLELFGWYRRRFKREHDRQRYRMSPSLRARIANRVRARRKRDGYADEIKRRRERMKSDPVYREHLLAVKRRSMARARAKQRAA